MFSYKDLNYVHCNNTGIIDITRTYDNSQNCHKPRGLWLSALREGKKDSDWNNFTRGSLMGKRHFQLPVKFDWSEILCLDTEEAIDYMLNNIDGKLFELFNTDLIDLEKYSRTLCYHDWNNISKDYKGIYYNPYLEEKFSDKFQQLNLYGWDIPSVCIWDLSIVIPQ